MTITWTQNTTAQTLQCSCVSSTGAVIELTNATNVILKLKLAQVNTPYVPLSGTATITNPTGGTFTYQFAAADVAQSGDFQLLVEIQFGALILNMLPVLFSIQPTM